MIYQVKSRLKVAILFFIVAFLIAGVGVYVYIFKHKEPTHGVFVYNNDKEIKEALVCGHLYKPSKEDNHY